MNPKMQPKGGDAQRGQKFAQHSPFRPKPPIPLDPRRQAIDMALGGAVAPGFFMRNANPPGRRKR